MTNPNADTPLTDEQREVLFDRFFALSVRHAAAQYRKDDDEIERMGDALDVVWRQIGNDAEPIFKQAALYLGLECVPFWPTAKGEADQVVDLRHNPERLTILRCDI